MSVTLIRADCATWRGECDFVFTHPYGPLPKDAQGKPSIINLYTAGNASRVVKAENWVGSRLVSLGCWGRNITNTVFVANLEWREVLLSDLVEDDPGWFPEELVRRLLHRYADKLEPDSVIWDGFCGRATVGKVAAIELGYSYIGIDRDPARIELSRAYLGLGK